MSSTSFEYIGSKIEHMKRLGLVSSHSTGFGFHGGVAPDWLAQEQKAQRAANNKRRANEWTMRSWSPDEDAS